MAKYINSIKHKHLFQRLANPSDSSSESSFLCHVCQNKWVENGIGVVSKQYYCSECGVNVHTSCRFMAERCYPCNRSTEHCKKSYEESTLKPLNISGNFAIRLLNAYDLNSSLVPSGTHLYGILSIPTEEGVIRTGTACKGENDCVWPGGASGGFDSDSDFILTYSGSSSEKEVSSHAPAGAASSLILRIELWRSVMFVFDSFVALAEVSLIPVMYYPEGIIERWFGITCPSGEPCGSVLLRIQFIPNSSPPATFSSSMSDSLILPPLAPESIPIAVVSESDPPVTETLRPVATRIPGPPTPLSTVASKNEDTGTISAAEIREPFSSAVRSNAEIFSPKVKAVAADVSKDISTTHSSPVRTAGPTPIVVPANELHNPVAHIASVPSPAPKSASKTQSPAPPVMTSLTPKKPPNESASSHFNFQVSPSAEKDGKERRKSKKLDKTNLNRAAVPLNAPLSPGMLSQWAVSLGQRAQKTIESIIYEDRDVVAQDAASGEASPIPPSLKDRAGGKGDVSQLGFGRSKPLKSGVGRFYVHLVSVLRTEVSDAAEGSHYVTLSVDGQEESERRTQTIHSSAAPVFNKNFRLTAAHYRNSLKLTLVDALTGRKIGQSKISASSILQRDADSHNGDWRRAKIEKIPIRDPSNVDKVGYFTMCVAFEEDIKGLFLDSKPRFVAAEAPEQWSVERFQIHIARFKSLIALVSEWYSEYCKIMEWDNKILTFALFVVFLVSTLYIDAEYALCCPLLALAVCLTLSLRRRKNGAYKQYWISRGAPTAAEAQRPVAVLRIAVLGFRNMPEASSGGSALGSSTTGSSSTSVQSMASTVTSLVASVGAAGSSLLASTNNTAVTATGPLSTTALSALSSSRPFVKLSYIPMPETANMTDKDIKEYAIGTVASHYGHDHGLSTSASRGAARGFDGRVGLSGLMSSLQLPGMRNETASKDGILHNTMDPWPVGRGTPRGQLTEVISQTLVNPAFSTVLGESARIVESLVEEASASLVARKDAVKENVTVGQRGNMVKQLHDGSKLDVAYVYPLLQPMNIPVVLPPPKSYDSDSDSEEESQFEGDAALKSYSDQQSKARDQSGLVPWDKNTGIVKFSLFHDDPSASVASRFLDPTIGVVKVRLSDLAVGEDGAADGNTFDSKAKGKVQEEFNLGDATDVSRNREICRWFDVSLVRAAGLATTAADFAATKDEDEVILKSSASVPALAPNKGFYHAEKDQAEGSEEESGRSDQPRPQILVRMSLSLHSASVSASATTEKKTGSATVLTSVSAIGPPDEKAISMAILASLADTNAGGSSWVSTIWNTTGYLEYVSNLMSWLLDSIESFKNIFNWSSPGKTYPLYCAVVALWLVTIFVPGRYLILAMGLYQFLSCFLPKGKGDSPTTVRFYNLLTAVPNDDDLDKIYHFEKKEFADTLLQQRSMVIRNAKKNLVLTTLWEGTVQMKVASSLRGPAVGTDWVNMYLLLQNKRLVWWNKEQDIDDGKTALGQLLLHGHTGTTSASPVEVREIGDDSRLVAIFGCDTAGKQLKCTVLCCDIPSCSLLKSLAESMLKV